MGMRYEIAHDVRKLAEDIVRVLEMRHVDLSRVVFVRSFGSSSRRVLARCHGLSRIWQKALGLRPHYVIEVIAENFDRLSHREKVETIVHELMHIPKSFGGGFRHHGWVNSKNVKKMTNEYLKRKKTMPIS